MELSPTRRTPRAPGCGRSWRPSVTSCRFQLRVFQDWAKNRPPLTNKRSGGENRNETHLGGREGSRREPARSTRNDARSVLHRAGFFFGRFFDWEIARMQGDGEQKIAEVCPEGFDYRQLRAYVRISEEQDEVVPPRVMQ